MGAFASGKGKEGDAEFPIKKWIKNGKNLMRKRGAVL